MPGSTDANFSDNFSEVSYRKPKRSLPVWVYDGKNKTLFGRNGRSWFLIFVFYAIFFSTLAAFFMAMMMTFLHFIIPQSYPLRSGQHSLLKLTPGLGLRPSPNAAKTLIKYSVNDPQTSAKYVQNIQAFLSNYYDLESKPNDFVSKCENGVKTPNELDRVCKFDLAQLGPCIGTGANLYGYGTYKPCVFLKINKIYGWVPDVKDQSVPHPLVSCSGQNPLDIEHIGKLNYFPSASVNGTTYGKFDNSFFPYVGQTSYVGPIIAVQFENLKKHTTVLIECDMINLNTQTSVDKVQFEMLID